MAQQRTTLYSSDISKIQSLFKLKKKSMLTRQRGGFNAGRRYSVFRDLTQQLFAKQKYSQSNVRGDVGRKMVPHINPARPEALTFEDFTKCDFSGGRPQFLMDFLKYTTGIDPRILLGIKHVENEDTRVRSEKELLKPGF
jgi:hypothetical protein